MLDEYTVYPVQGCFDTDRIVSYLESQGHVGRDPILTESLRFLVCGNADGVMNTLQKRIDDPRRTGPVGIIDVGADRIEIAQECSVHTLRQMRDFVVWLTAAFACKLFDTETKQYVGMDALFPGDMGED